MKTVYPDYYKNFKCIAEKCRHNCCIGWEIDIDPQSLEFYKSVKGDFGKRLRDNISIEGTPHFKLKENERCPFLNDKNLCDIYTELGEKSLCQICFDHPRFYNELDGKIEAGLGLCCEEAARLIITKKEPLRLIGLSENLTSGTIQERNLILKILQDRALPVNSRVEKMLNLTVGKAIDLDISNWVMLFESLERLDECWSNLLSLLKEKHTTSDTKAFDTFMESRQTEYEQFLCYLIYRHLSKSDFVEDIAIYCVFAALSYNLIHAIGSVLFAEKGDFTIQNQLEIMRLFSSEIEYSDENTDIILDEIENRLYNTN